MGVGGKVTEGVRDRRGFVNFLFISKKYDGQVKKVLLFNMFHTSFRVFIRNQNSSVPTGLYNEGIKR